MSQQWQTWRISSLVVKRLEAVVVADIVVQDQGTD